MHLSFQYADEKKYICFELNSNYIDKNVISYFLYQSTSIKMLISLICRTKNCSFLERTKKQFRNILKLSFLLITTNSITWLWPENS